MDLHTVQLIFYILGIIFLSVMVFVLVTIGIAFFVIKRKINKITQQVSQKILHATHIYDYKEELVSQLLTKGTHIILKNIAKIMPKKKTNT